MARAWEAAFEAGLSVVVGVVLGYYADRWLGTEPVLLFLFMILGGVAGVRRLLGIQVAPLEPGAARDPRGTHAAAPTATPPPDARKEQRRDGAAASGGAIPGGDREDTGERSERSERCER
jgi:hypothetical protein